MRIKIYTGLSSLFYSTKRYMTKPSKDHLLYYNPGSVFSNIGVLLLCEKGIQDQFEFKPIQMGVDNIAPWYISLNPKGQVPTLVHEGKSIPDTLSIAQYLDGSFGDEAIFSTEDPKVLEIVEKWRQVRVLSLLAGKKSADQDVSKMDKTLQDSRDQVLKYMNENPELAEAYKVRLHIHDDRAQILIDHDTHVLHKERLEALLQETESTLEQNDGYLLPSKRHTVADVYATGILYWLKSKLDKDIISNRPFLDQYYNEQSQRASFKKAFQN